ncbi:hypothetical protein QBC46DRAFT_373707 [Diplogelasinospora grovesii]|uniref:Secreted protein n=1 Tax=Diplogelasinospora grovesii TaxID=303347 RepID=A0AAN6NEZ7_9PEZI|nr:hypothetical protein QBC46DRAFT_373707 [Diplogelasinospora grovesii]
MHFLRKGRASLRGIWTFALAWLSTLPRRNASFLAATANQWLSSLEVCGLEPLEIRHQPIVRRLHWSSCIITLDRLAAHWLNGAVRRAPLSRWQRPCHPPT